MVDSLDKISNKIFLIFLCRKANAAEIRGNNKHGRISVMSVMSVDFIDKLLKAEKKISDLEEKCLQKTRRRNRKKTSGDSESGYSSMMESGYSSSNRDSASENRKSASNFSSG